MSSFGHWLKGATRIRLDSHTLGNVLKNGAVAGGTLAGGPLGLAIGGVGSAAGQAALGGNLGESLHAGLQGAGTTGGLQAAKGFLGHLGGASVPGSVGGADAGAGPSGVVSDGNGGWSGYGSHLGDSALPAPTPQPSFLHSALGAGKGLAEWAGDHDKTTSTLLSGLGDVLDPTAQRLQRAQAAALEQQTADSGYDYNQKKARDLAMEPLRQALYGSLGTQIAGNYGQIAANPYAKGV